MVPTPETAFELVGLGSDLGIRVTGPTAESCLAAAAEAFAAFLGEVDAALPRRRSPLFVPGATPEELLVGLLDELIVRVDADGELAVALAEPVVDGAGLHGTLEVVDLGDVEVHEAAPKAATWHDLRLARVDDGWAGQVMLDL